jgi:arylsulfatase A-like enzyme
MSDNPPEPQQTRRDFLQAGTAAATLIASRAQAQNTGGKRPNIIFFLGEGHRADALSLERHPLVKTPNHDRIAHEGVYFRNSFVMNALCAPMRAATLTGMYSHSTGALGNNTRDPLPASIPMFTDLLHEAGYETALCGKAHVGNGAKERPWDYYFAYNNPATNYYHPVVFDGGKGNITGPHTYEGYADDVVTDHALEWLKQPREKPFCLLLWWTAPHAPFYRARRHLDLYNGVPIAKPATFDDDKKNYPGKPRAFADAANKIGTTVAGDCARSLEELVKDYCAGLVAIDENVGRVLDHLTRTNQMDDSIILNTSDHGYFLGEWRMFDKRFMHEPSIRVPTMIRYPKAFKAGSKVDAMITNLDIAPTLLELAGVEVPARMQGKSLVKLAQGDEGGWRKDWLYEYYEYPAGEKVLPHRGVRTERYKLIHYYQEPQEWELYDLHADPGERNNLYTDASHAALVTLLKNRIAELRRETGDPAES